MIRVVNPSSSPLEYVKAARLFLIRPKGRPYLGAAVMALRLVETTSLPTAAVDSSWRMYYNPQFMLRGEVEATAAVVEHEIWHLLRRHPERAKNKHVTNRTAKAWNYAADAEIHSDEGLVNRIKKTGVEPVTPQSLGKSLGGKWEQLFVPGLLAEQYFDMLMEAIEEGEDPFDGEGEGDGNGDGEGTGFGPEDEQGPQVGGGNCGSAATGIPMDWEEAPTDKYVDKTDERIIRKKVAKQIIKDAALGRGVDKGDALYEWADEELAPPKVNWQQKLRSVVRGAIAYVSGSYEYTRGKLSRRQIHSPRVILPGLQHPIPEVAVVVDTSGSMFASFNQGSPEAEEKYNLLDQALSETKNIIRSFGQTIGVQVYATDTTVAWTGRVFDPSQIKAAGGGGTDIGVGMKAAYQAPVKPQVMVVLTDGATPWPDTPPPGIKVVVGLIGETTEEVAEHGWPIPPYAEVIEITSDK